MKFHELKAHLESLTRAQANVLATDAGVPASTVAKIRKGHTEDPGVLTIEKLVAAIGKRPRKPKTAQAV